MVKLDQLVLEFSCSRQRRPQNAIFILKSSSLRFHRGTAKFIAQTRNPSRRFEELDPETLHICSMGHYAKSDDWGGSIFFFIFDLEGSKLRAFVQKKLEPPKNGEKSRKVETPQSSDFA